MQLVAWINIPVFVLTAWMVGGLALNGKREAGHYYVVDHGHHTEVSRTAWVCCSVEQMIFMITSPVVLAGDLLNGNRIAHDHRYDEPSGARGPQPPRDD
jgi:hypothetical protein